jgi:hypothetical protein
MSMTLISTVTVGTAASFVSLDDIPQTFTDLYAVASLRSSTAVTSEQIHIYINGDGSSSYANRILTGNGSSASSNTFNTFAFSGGVTAPGTSATSNTFGSLGLYIPNYTSTTTKSFAIDAVSENNATAANQSIIAGSYTTTSPITFFSFNNNSGNWVVGSTVSLYGILRGSGGATTSP